MQQYDFYLFPADLVLAKHLLSYSSPVLLQHLFPHLFVMAQLAIESFFVKAAARYSVMCHIFSKTDDRFFLLCIFYFIRANNISGMNINCIPSFLDTQYSVHHINRINLTYSFGMTGDIIPFL